MTTTNLGMTKPTVGADSDTWGGELNADLDLIDAFAGKLMPGAEVSIASAAVTDIGAAASTAVAITGNNTITSLGTAPNCIRFVRFAGALALTHNAVSLILPGGGNIVTAAGDAAIFKSDASGNWRAISYSATAYNPAAHTGTGAFVHATSPTVDTLTASAVQTTNWVAVGGSRIASNMLSVYGGANIQGDILAANILLAPAGSGTLTCRAFGADGVYSSQGLTTQDGNGIKMICRTNGVILSDGAATWQTISDERAKTDLVSIENASAKVSSLRAVTGRYLTDGVGKRRAFLIAQDVQAVLPEAVGVYANTQDSADPNNGHLILSYTDVIPLLVAALKEANARLAILEAS